VIIKLSCEIRVVAGTPLTVPVKDAISQKINRLKDAGSCTVIKHKKAEGSSIDFRNILEK